jgi:hypothetical protein
MPSGTPPARWPTGSRQDDHRSPQPRQPRRCWRPRSAAKRLARVRRIATQQQSRFPRQRPTVAQAINARRRPPILHDWWPRFAPSPTAPGGLRSARRRRRARARSCRTLITGPRPPARRPRSRSRSCPAPPPRSSASPVASPIRTGNSSSRCAATAASTADRGEANAAHTPSPVCLNNQPSCVSIARRSTSSYAASAFRMPSASASHRRVDPSTSVNKRQDTRRRDRGHPHRMSQGNGVTSNIVGSGAVTGYTCCETKYRELLLWPLLRRGSSIRCRCQSVTFSSIALATRSASGTAQSGSPR